MEPTTEETTAPIEASTEQQAMAVAAIESQVGTALPEPTLEVAPGVVASGGELISAPPGAPVEVELAPGVVVDGPGAEKIKTADEQIKELNAQLEQLEAQREKTIVEELVCEPEQLAAVAMIRRKERYPRALKDVEKHLKQLAWSGERVAFLETNTPIFNDMIVKDLVALGFKARVISLGGNQGFKIEVKY